MTTPEPARAEPVGGDTKRLSPLFAASVSSDGRPALQWIGHGRIVLPEGTSVDTLADFVNRIVDMERPAAPAPASDAGLAEVERLLWAHDVAVIAECDGMSRLDGDSPVMEGLREASGATTAAVFSAFAAQAATIAALRADNDRLLADAAGRGEGVTKAGTEALEDAAAHLGPKGLRPCDCEHCDCGNSGDHARVVAWDEATALSAAIRARIAAAPAPATTDNSGDTHA